ncbi:MAG: hypothetical protein ACTSPV_15630 [Candidatus Hodarchaeales archaeon]
MDLSGYEEELAHPDFDWNAISGADWDYRFYWSWTNLSIFFDNFLAERVL